jgi:hypothetical protein
MSAHKQRTDLQRGIKKFLLYFQLPCTINRRGMSPHAFGSELDQTIALGIGPDCAAQLVTSRAVLLRVTNEQ